MPRATKPGVAELRVILKSFIPILVFRGIRDLDIDVMSDWLTRWAGLEWREGEPTVWKINRLNGAIEGRPM